MEENKQAIQKKIEEFEAQMGDPVFWQDKVKAQTIIKEYNDLKAEIEGEGKYDRLNAVITLFSGAGGDDSEDFSRMLFEMYGKFAQKKGWGIYLLHKNENDHGGFRNITFEVQGKNAYGELNKESGVHRLVRISPFNAAKKRHTSFSMVEVIPKFEKVGDFELPEKEVEISYAKSSGPGGQNVNKRETAVRAVHVPTGISAHVESERSQGQNKERAIAILKGKLHKALEEERIKKQENMYISKTTSIEWGNQIRSYVLHPYKMVKDHRTGVETSDVEAVLEDGALEAFVEAEKKM
ncbi:MAG: PCRF domain-containing protein [bacterium]|nr:PCRF domain-containing protein [bacterium]